MWESWGMKGLIGSRKRKQTRREHFLLPIYNLFYVTGHIILLRVLYKLSSKIFTNWFLDNRLQPAQRTSCLFFSTCSHPSITTRRWRKHSDTEKPFDRPSVAIRGASSRWKERRRWTQYDNRCRGDPFWDSWFCTRVERRLLGIKRTPESFPERVGGNIFP